MECNDSCSRAEGMKPSEGYGHIDTEGLERMIASGVPFVILDARSGKYDDGKRIATAEVCSDDASEKELTKLIPTKKSLIVVYCFDPKCPLGGALAKHLLGFGYSNILKYDEGIEGWEALGRPIRKVR